MTFFQDTDERLPDEVARTRYRRATIILEAEDGVVTIYDAPESEVEAAYVLRPGQRDASPYSNDRVIGFDVRVQGHNEEYSTSSQWQTRHDGEDDWSLDVLEPLKAFLDTYHGYFGVR